MSVCNFESENFNAIIPNNIAHKNLELGPDKCFELHVGQQSDCCPTLKINEEIMLSSSKEKTDNRWRDKY